MSGFLCWPLLSSYLSFFPSQVMLGGLLSLFRAAKCPGAGRTPVSPTGSSPSQKRLVVERLYWTVAVLRTVQAKATAEQRPSGVANLVRTGGDLRGKVTAALEAVVRGRVIWR